jgi:hypothetical protein
MDLDSFDRYLIEQMSNIQNNCFLIIEALKEGRIDKDTALAILSNLENSAMQTFNKREEIFNSAKLDYSKIEDAKQAFASSLEEAVSEVLSKDVSENEHKDPDEDENKIITSLLH